MFLFFLNVAIFVAYMDGIKSQICWRFEFGCGVIIKVNVKPTGDMAH